MEIEGVVYQVPPLVNGRSARGEWSRQDVVVELPGEFNRKLCIEFWGDRAADASALRVGDKVNISFNVESRENNGRWYTSARAWKMSRVQPEPQPAMHDALPPIDQITYTGDEATVDDLPF